MYGVHRVLCDLCVLLTGKINCKYATKNEKLDIPEGVPSGIWDMFVSIKADTAATSLRVDHLEARVDDLEESRDSGLAEKVAELSNTVNILLARLAKYEKIN